MSSPVGMTELVGVIAASLRNLFRPLTYERHCSEAIFRPSDAPSDRMLELASSLWSFQSCRWQSTLYRCNMSDAQIAVC